MCYHVNITFYLYTFEIKNKNEKKITNGLRGNKNETRRHIKSLLK